MYKCFIAMSIDGYIADANESIEFLEKFDHELSHTNYFSKQYSTFYNDVDNVVIGRNTYDFVINHIAKNDLEYPYLGKRNYLITSQEIKIDNDDVRTFSYQQFKEMELEGKTWIVGGGELVGALLDDNLIDNLIITIVPVVLGSGTKLSINKSMHQFRLASTNSEGDFIELNYVK
jgi:dihydrofolate reductase